ncbi:MAG: DNA recombination protein RmuC, partial [Eubacteriales bacterium]|nr:DNA recombination protein RmuC [Eubacteriales bacterium]
KLDKSLNERLDNSFKTIGEQLQNLHKNLGELQSLSVGVDSLQKTLSNVKTRGVFGEIQLSNILANTMDKSQYEEQFVIKENKDERVDFAIKIPDKDAKDNFLYLPIDAKFPSDMYLHIVNASNEKNQEALNRAIEELRRAIEKQAKSIKDKYIDTPKTTAFAILFLPTEALYAEVLRIDGLAEKCQNEYNIIIQGPTTITALINSFSIGFKYLTVNKKAFEIGKTLEAIKGQYNIFSDLIIKTKKKLEDAKKATEDLSFRNEQINKKLKNIASLPSVESNKQLEINVYDEEEVVD